eukprot:SAG22_NODE_18293_length_289_cov_1.357895_1_plen_68_part_01
MRSCSSSAASKLAQEDQFLQEYADKRLSEADVQTKANEAGQHAAAQLRAPRSSSKGAASASSGSPTPL